MVVNGQTLDNIYVGFNTIFNKTFLNTETLYEQIATVVNSTTKTEHYKWMGQIPRLREWIGDRQIQNLAAHDYTIKNKKFESTIGVDVDDIEDDTLGIYPILVEQLAESAAMFPDELCFELLAKGFVKKCYDKQNFFGDHKVGKKTVSNKGDKKLTPESYAEARSMLMSQTDEKGKALKVLPNILVIPPQLEDAAKRILLADVVDATTNIYKDSAKPLVVPDLASNPNAWFLLDTTKPLKPLIYQNRKSPKITSLNQDTDQNVFMNAQALYGVDTRGNAGYGFWQLAFGSVGEV